MDADGAASTLHYGDEVALVLYAATDRKLCLAYDAKSRTLYAGNETSVCCATLYDASDSAQNIEDLPIVAYHRDTGGHHGPSGHLGPSAGWSRLDLEIHDPDRTYKAIGRAGEDGEAVQPLAEVIVSRGYVVAGAEESEDLDPHYIVEARYTHGRGPGRLLLQALDGWGLLDQWRPVMPIVYEGRSARDILEDLAAKVGLAYDDTATSALGRTLSEFRVLPSQTAASAISSLLTLCGCAALFQEDGTLYAVELYSYAPNAVTVGTEGQITRGEFSQTAREPNSFHVLGDGVAAADLQPTANMALGLRVHRRIVDHRYTSSGQATDRTNALYTQATLGRRRDQVTVPLRPDLELWDRVQLTDHGGIIPDDDNVRRVVRIRELWRARAGRLETYLTLGYE